LLDRSPMPWKSTKLPQQGRKAEMKALEEQIQAKMAEKKLKKERTIPSRTPLYDEVFFEGVRWLDSLAGEPIQREDII
jgi:hypothetical protein